ISKQVENNHLNQQKQLDSMQKQLVQIAELNENKIENMRRTIEEKVNQMQENSQKKLDEIRVTVEEKLQSTLEKRLGESFKLVSNQLEMVHKGLGEMQHLATGVGDLKKVLTNVKTKGIWGEVQLGSILKQILSEEQYAVNAKIDPLSNQRVEYALKLPNKDEENSETLLPIDAKLPLVEYYRLIEFYEDGDKLNIEKQIKILEAIVMKEAKSINEKYIKPPHSTDFAVMFLPVEGLYAEVVRIPGLLEKLQREYRVIVTSPTTLTALLNSVQMGFKTLAIEKRSSEVWKLLDSVKHEFSNFVSILSKTKVKLDQASKAIGEAEYKGNVIKNKLQNVEKLPLSK
ncbi:MAG: DNA recombination protein RmuC, partial [Rickettsiales bacterium]|nr:DNA recombination protein RmuC [Rickettsiales bacterium]